MTRHGRSIDNFFDLIEYPHRRPPIIVETGSLGGKCMDRMGGDPRRTLVAVTRTMLLTRAFFLDTLPFAEGVKDEDFPATHHRRPIRFRHTVGNGRTCAGGPVHGAHR